MYDHVGLRTADLEASAAFFRAALAPFGYQLTYQDDDLVGIGSPEQSFWIHRIDGGAGSNVHVAFRAASQGAVDQFHAAAIAAGATCNGEPGLRLAYGPGYYAAFVVDPHGNNIEAVCMTSA